MLPTHYYNSELIVIMTPQPPERISFILLKRFAPGSLLFTPWGSSVRFREDILWCLCCCNRLRLWGGACQLVYIPVFSLVPVHHERIAHMRHLAPFGRGEDHLWTSRLRDWQRRVLFSGVSGCFGVVCFCQCRLLRPGTRSKLWRKKCGATSTVVTSRSTDIIVFQSVRDGRKFVRQFVG